MFSTRKEIFPSKTQPPSYKDMQHASHHSIFQTVYQNPLLSPPSFPSPIPSPNLHKVERFPCIKSVTGTLLPTA